MMTLSEVLDISSATVTQLSPPDDSSIHCGKSSAAVNNCGWLCPSPSGGPADAGSQSQALPCQGSCNQQCRPFQLPLDSNRLHIPSIGHYAQLLSCDFVWNVGWTCSSCNRSCVPEESATPCKAGECPFHNEMHGSNEAAVLCVYTGCVRCLAQRHCCLSYVPCRPLVIIRKCTNFAETSGTGTDCWLPTAHLAWRMRLKIACSTCESPHNQEPIQPQKRGSRLAFLGVMKAHHGPPCRGNPEHVSHDKQISMPLEVHAG